MKFDAVIVLGTGIKQDGQLPDSSIRNIKRAVELYKNRHTQKLILAGKWAWNCKYTPRLTEAAAMRLVALNRGIPAVDILIEDQSSTIGSNLCNVKEKFLIPQNFKNIALVCISDVIKERMELNLKMILGPDYTYEIVMAESSYPPEKYAEIKESETKKMTEALKFYKDITPGDHKLINELGLADINNKLQNL